MQMSRSRPPAGNCDIKPLAFPYAEAKRNILRYQVAGDVAVITNISVPARAAITDTIKVGFTYVTAPCDTGLTVESRQNFDELRLTARSKHTSLPCASTYDITHAALHVVVPPHEAPLRLIFSEPDGNDSVRVVAP